jgi:hypothetical protein
MTSTGGSAADSAGYDAREDYTKYEYRIPMRDRVRLFTSVLVPKDTSTTYPILLTRTPFGISPYGVDEHGAISLQTEALLRAGYIFVRQDVRGRLMSEGTFTHVTPHRPEKPTSADVDEQSDTWDTVEWLLRHVPNQNLRPFPAGSCAVVCIDGPRPLRMLAESCATRLAAQSLGRFMTATRGRATRLEPAACRGLIRCDPTKRGAQRSDHQPMP